MDAKDIARLIDLERRKATLEFRKSLGVECDAELLSVSSQIKEAESGAEAAGVELAYPKQDRLEDLGRMLSEFSPQQMKEAISSRNGEAYGLLSERASISVDNHQNRFEIAKLALLMARMDRIERANVIKAVRAGKVAGPLKVGSLKEAERRRISRFMCRLGMQCSVDGAEIVAQEPEEKEVPMTIENRKVWVDNETSKALESNLKKMEKLGSELQVRNAKRHIMEFSEEEEKRYTSLQAEYLELLKQQDKLLSGYDREMVPETS